MAARFMAYGNGRCVFNRFYPLMMNVTVPVGIYGMMEGCVIVSIDSTRADDAGILYGVVLPNNHHGPRYLDVAVW